MRKALSGINIIAIIFATICVGLGSWQIQRKNWKEQLIAQYNQQQAMPALPFKQFPLDANFSQLEHRRVIVQGTLLYNKHMWLMGRVYNSKMGALLFIPIQMDAQTSTPITSGKTPPSAVNTNNNIIWGCFGWIQQNNISQASTLLNHIQEHSHINIVGNISTKHTQKAPFAQDNHDELLQSRKLYWLDLPRINTQAAIVSKNNTHYIHSNNKLLPAASFIITQPYQRNWRNNHLYYILTWFSLAIILLLFAWHYRK